MTENECSTEEKLQFGGSLDLNRRSVLLGALGLGAVGLFASGDAAATGDRLGSGGSGVDPRSGSDLFLPQGHQLPTKRVTETTDTYDNEPHLYRLRNDDLFLVYRRSGIEGGGHVNNTGRIVAQRSKDWGETWEDPITIADTEYDTRNQSVIYDEESGRITVMYRVLDAVSGSTKGGFYKTSADNGRSWSDPKNIELEYITEPPNLRTPYGDFTRTSNGLFTTWVGEGVDGGLRVTEGLFSTDGGRTWGNNVKIIDSSDYDGLFLTEPVPEAYTDEKVWVFGRDNDNARFFAVQSEDGGQTWGDATFFSPTEMQTGTPGWFEMTNPNELSMLWGDRTNSRVRSISVSARLAWQDPSLIEEQPVRDLAIQMADNSADFGYVSTENLGRDRRHIIATWYDEDVDPNIWISSLAGDGVSDSSTGDGTGGVIDGDLRVEAGSIPRFDIGAASDGTWDTVEIERFDVSFNESFEQPPVVVTVTNAASGLNSGTSNITANGFTAQVLNYQTNSRPAELDWIAVGE